MCARVFARIVETATAYASGEISAGELYRRALGGDGAAEMVLRASEGIDPEARDCLAALMTARQGARGARA